VFGIAILIGVIFQLVTGYALKRADSALIDREKQRADYWESIAVQVAMAFVVIGLGIYYK
jgi:hypothetical protein